MSLIRVIRTASATLSRTLYVDEAPTDAAGTVTVAVTRLDGTAVVSGNATHGGTGVYTYVLPGGPTSPSSATWQLDTLIVAWTGTIGGAVVTLTDEVEVVGSFIFGLAEARASDASLSNTTTYPATLLAARRIEVEDECERVCRQAFVPRFYREALSGRDIDRIGTRWPMLRRLRAVTVSGVAWTAPVVATVAVSESGMLTLPNGSVWPAGASNIVVEYEHGWDLPPPRLVSAAMRHLRYLLNEARSGIPDRVSSYTAEPAGTYRVELGVVDVDHTGFPAIDAVYVKYARHRRAVFA